MLVKQELVNKIKDYFNLNVYETKVWLALLSKGIASAGEVAEISGVPRSRTYDVLEGLEKRGFAIEKMGKPVKYIGVKPKMILEKIKNNVRQETEEKIEGLSKIKDTEEFTMIENLYNSGLNPAKREDLSASLKGKSNISNYLREILREAKKEVIVCTNTEELNSKTKLFKNTFELLDKNGIKLNIALSGTNEEIKKVSEKFGLKFKQIKIYAKFFIIDRKEILFYVSKDPEEDVAIWLNSEFFSDAFAEMFEKAIGK